MEPVFKKYTINRTVLGGLATHLVTKYEHGYVLSKDLNFGAVALYKP